MSTENFSKKRNMVGLGLKVFRVSKGLTLKDVADKIDSSTGFISEVERGLKMPGSAYILAMKRNFPDLDLNSLFVIHPNEDVDAEVLFLKDLRLGIEKVAIPYYDSVEAAAGGGIIPPEGEEMVYLSVPRSYIYNVLHSSPGEIYILKVRGDSMEPRIPNGSLIFIKRGVQGPFGGDVYLVRINDSIFCKRLQQIPGNRIQVMSDNKYYDSFVVDADAEDFQVIGKVIGNLSAVGNGH